MAMARPIPREPPVTMTTLFSSSLMLIRPVELAIRIEAHTESRSIGYLHSAVYGHGLIEKERCKHRYDVIGFRSHHQELGEWTIVARDHEMIAVNARAVRYDQRLVGIGERRDLDEFCEPPAPAYIRLDNVAAFHIEEQPKAPARGFVLAGRHEYAAGDRALKIGVPPIVIRRQSLF